MSNQIVITSGAKLRDLDDVIVATDGILSSVAFNVANGVPRLDENGKILVSQLPNSVMEFKGVWNAATNTPTLVNGTGNAGDVWLCNVAGTVNFGAGPIAFAVGDYAVYTGTVWARSSGATGTVTSVGVSRDGNALTITGSPVTSSGTINLGFSGDNTQYINGAGNLTTFPTLITSIGLTMPAAFGVSNSPLTANGTIGVTALGYPSQYIRGDGTLADFPTSGGGGSSVSYYLNGGVSQGTIGGTTYYEMSKIANTGTMVDFSKTGDGFITAFLTDAGDPALLQIPAGNWDFEIYASMSSNGGTPELYAELYKYDGTTFTLIATSSHEILYDGVNLNLYSFATAVPQTSLTVTDRLAIKLYAHNSGGKTTTIHTQDSHLCQVITTFSTGLTALNGLTAQVQYFGTGTSGSDFNIVSSVDTHTFNLPTASATKRGALSSADWSTFNGKQDYITAGTTLEYWRGDKTWQTLNTLVVPELTNLYFTNARARTAISLTTTGSTGASTYDNSTGVFNIPNYADQYVGTVTSVDMSVPTGLSVSGNPITTSGTLAVTFASGYSIPTNASQTTWDTAYTNRITSLTTTGTSGAATLVSNTLNIPQYQAALTNPVTGTGTINKLAKFSATGSTITDSIITEASGVVTITSVAEESFKIYGDTGVTNGLFRISTSTKTDTFATGARTFLGDGGIDIFIGTANASQTPTNTYIVLNQDGEIYMGAGSTPSKQFTLSTSGNLAITGSITGNSIIKSGGTSSQYLMADGSTSTLTNPVTGTGVNGRVTLWNGTSSVSSESSLTWSGTGSTFKLIVGAQYSYLGIGGTGASAGLDLVISGDDGIRFLVSNASITAMRIIDGGPIQMYDSLTVSNTINGVDANFSGDLRIYRASAATTGYINFGSTGTNYFGWNGSGFVANGSIDATILNLNTSSTVPLQIYGDNGGINGLFRIEIDEVNDTFGTGARTFLGDGSTDIFIGTGNSSYTPNNSYIALNHSGEISMGAGASVTKDFILSTDGNLTITGSITGNQTITTGKTTSDAGGSFVMNIGNGTNYVGNANSTTIYSDSAGRLMLSYKNATQNKIIGLSTSIDNTQTYLQWPSSDGTIALTSQIPSLSGYVTGSGAANRISYWSTSSNITSSSNLTFDGTQMGLGTSPVSNVKLTINQSGDNYFLNMINNSSSLFSVVAQGTAVSGFGIMYVSKAGSDRIILNANGESSISAGSGFSSSGNYGLSISNGFSPSTGTFNNGGTWAAANNYQAITWGSSSATVNSGAVIAGFNSVNRNIFNTAGVSITVNQTSYPRAISAFQVLQQTGGTNAGTISHGAGVFIQGIYPTSASNTTFTNYYALLINPLDEWGGVTLTNRWGIYQAGASDKNYLSGSTQVDNNLQVNNLGIGQAATGARIFVNQTTNSEWIATFKNYGGSASYGVNIDMSGSSSSQAAFQIYTSTGSGIKVHNTGRLGVGTFTDNGYTLDVNGTMRGNNLTLNAATISNSGGIFGAGSNGAYAYLSGNLANGEKYGSLGGTYVQGFYFISWYSTSGRGYAIFATVSPTANAGTVLVSSGGWASASATYNASSAISVAFDGSGRGPILSNNTGTTVSFYVYAFGAS